MLTQRLLGLILSIILMHLSYATLLAEDRESPDSCQSNVIIRVNEVYGCEIRRIEQARVQIFMNTGERLGDELVTDAGCRVRIKLSEGEYTVRADYMGNQYQAAVSTGQEIDIDIEHARVKVRVTLNGEAVRNVRVSLFTPKGEVKTNF